MQEDAATPFAPLATCSPDLAVTCAKLRRLAHRNPRSCWSVRPASARKCSRTRSTRTAAAPAARRHQLRGDPPRAGRERAVRLRKGRAFDRPGTQGRPRRAGRQGHAVPRRDRRHAVRAAIEAAALPAGSPLHAAGIDARRRGRRAHRGRHQPHRSGEGAQVQEAVLGRLGAQPSCCRRCATGSRTSAGWSRISSATSRRPRVRAGGVPRALPAPLAAERARAVEGDRRGGGAEPRRATIGLEHLPDAVTATLQLDVEDDFETTDVDPAPPPVDAAGDDASLTRAAAPATARAGPHRRARS